MGKMERAGDKVMIWSDENVFTVQAVTNQQNDRACAANNNDLPQGSRMHFRRQKPAGLMVWAAMASDGNKSLLLFVEEGMKVNSGVYLQMLQGSVLPWVTEQFGTSCIFTQNLAPAHTANVSQKWSSEHFAGFWDKNVSPPSSPNINPMDYAIWSIIGTDVSKVYCSNVPDLKEAMVTAWADFDEEVVRRTCASVTSCLRAVIRAKGGHIEK